MIAESINFSFLFFLLGLKCGCKFGGSVSHGTKWMAELVHNQYGGMASPSLQQSSYFGACSVESPSG